MARIDEYKSLAWKVYRRYNHIQLKKLLEDPEFVVDLILEELWDNDWEGVWCDTIMQGMRLLVDKEEVDKAMRGVAESLADRIDWDRLRNALLEIAS